MMMIDVLVVNSLHSMVSFCRFGFFVCSCGSIVVLCSGYGYVVELLVVITPGYWFFVCFTLAFLQKGLFLLECIYFIASCLSQVIQMIGSGCKFTDKKNLRTLILFADLDT